MRPCRPVRRWGIWPPSSSIGLVTAPPGQGSLHVSEEEGAPHQVAGSSRTARSASPCSAGRAHLRDSPAGRGTPLLDQSAVSSRPERTIAATWSASPTTARRQPTSDSRGSADTAKPAPSNGARRAPRSRQRDALTFFYGADLPKTQYAIERAVTVRAGEPAVQVDEWVENRAAYDRPYNWNQHATFGAPFVAPDANVLDLSGDAALTDARRTGGEQWSAAAEFRWPDAPRADGGSLSLRPFRARPERQVYTPVRTAASDALGWFTLYNLDHRLLVGYLFPAADHPWIVDWQNRPDAGQPGPDGARHPVWHVALRRGAAQERRARAAVRHADLPVDRRAAAALDQVPDLPDRGAAGLRRRRRRARDRRPDHRARARGRPARSPSAADGHADSARGAPGAPGKPSLKNTHSPSSLGRPGRAGGRRSD